MQNELETQRKLGSHNNILSSIDDAYKVNNIGLSQSYSPDGLVYEFYYGGDLVDYYAKNSSSNKNEKRITKLMKGLWSAIDHCHKSDVCHRDIKPQNVLYDKKRNSLLLADFGMSCPSTNLIRAGTSRYYSAPECYERKEHLPYNYKCDIWSAGATHLTMIIGAKILEGKNGFKLRKHGYYHIKNNYQKMWNGFSVKTQNMLVGALRPNPFDRCEAEDIVDMLC